MGISSRSYNFLIKSSRNLIATGSRNRDRIAKSHGLTEINRGRFLPKTKGPAQSGGRGKPSSRNSQRSKSSSRGSPASLQTRLEFTRSNRQCA